MPKTGFITTESGVEISEALACASRERNMSKAKIIQEALFKELAKELLHNQKLSSNIANTKGIS